MKCPRCRNKIDPGQKFCDRCGEKIPPTGKKKMKPFMWIPIGVGALCLVLIGAAVVFISPEETEAAKLQKQLDLGNKYLASADYDNAKAAFDKALEIDEKSPDAALGLAKVYNEKEEPEEALMYLEKASDNLEEMSVDSLVSSGKNVSWNKKAAEYEQAFDRTIDLFESGGDTKRAQAAKEEKANTNEIIIYMNQYYYNINEEEKKQETAEEPEETGEPEAAAIPEPTVTPEVTAAPEPTVTPEVTAAPEPTVTPEVTAAPEPTVTPEVTATPEPTVTPEVTAAPEPTVTPEITAAPTVDPNLPGGEEIDGIPPATEDGTYVTTAEPEDGQEAASADEAVVEILPAETPDNGEENMDIFDEQGDSQTAEETDTTEVSQEPEETEEPTNTGEQTDDVSPETLLSDYWSNTIYAERPIASFGGAAFVYDYANPDSFKANVDGIVGMKQMDVDKDSIPELLVGSMIQGVPSFEIYKVVNGAVAQTASVSSLCGGMGSALSDYTYGSTQICFVKDMGDKVYIGFAIHNSGVDTGDGNPSVRTSVELYEIGTAGEAALVNAVTIQNGTTVYTNGDPANVTEGGKDSFINILGQYGLSGSWISTSADTLAGMDLVSNPQQDVSVVQDPIRNGLASLENGVEDLLIVTGDMSAGSASLTMGLTDNISEW